MLKENYNFKRDWCDVRVDSMLCDIFGCVKMILGGVKGYIFFFLEDCLNEIFNCLSVFFDFCLKWGFFME